MSLGGSGGGVAVVVVVLCVFFCCGCGGSVGGGVRSRVPVVHLGPLVLMFVMHIRSVGWVSSGGMVTFVHFFHIAVMFDIICQR